MIPIQVMSPHKKHGRLRTSQFYWDFAMSVLEATAWKATQIGRRENLKKSRGRNGFELRSRSGLRRDIANEQSHKRGHRGFSKGLPRATSDWVGNRRAKLTNGFVLNTIGRPAYSFPSDSPPSVPDGGARAKNKCFLRHGSVPKHGCYANKSLQATRDGALSSASRFTLVGPACLSSGR
jgi:hypothetical protein